MPNSSPAFPTFAWQKVKGVVLFADLVSFFPRVAGMTLDQLSAFMQQQYGFWGTEVRKQNGEVISYIADSVLALFTEAGCQGKDPEWCAALTAFHLQKGAKKCDPELEISVGIHSGECLLGTWQEQSRDWKTILGQPVNKTAQIMAAAKQAGIFISKPVLDVLGPRVKSERLMIRSPGNPSQEETLFRLTSLVL